MVALRQRISRLADCPRWHSYYGCTARRFNSGWSVHAWYVRLRYWRKGKWYGRAGWRCPRKGRDGEEADDRELGGTEMHSSVSGVVEYLVEDDAHGIFKRARS